MMNASVAGLPLLTTQKSCPTSTRPSNLSLYHFFAHLSLIRLEGCNIWSISDFLDPWPGRRRTVRSIVFCHFRNFCDSTEYGVARAGLSELSCFYE